MKKRIYGLIMSALVISVGLTSCLKDKKVDDQEYGLINLNANKIIEIPTNTAHEISLTLLPEGLKDLTIGEVRLAAENPASEDIVVSLTTAKTSEIIDPELPLFPLDQITVPATVTIPKGERSAPLVVKVNTTLLESAPQYLAISITSVDKQGYIISGNYGLAKVNLKVKNRYEGQYVLTGTMEHLPSPGAYVHITTVWDPDPYVVQLQTKDGQSLQFYDENLFTNGFTYPIATAAGGASGWGSFSPVFKFDDAGNVIEVTNYYGQPAASNTRSAELDPTGVNKYDPATKSFKVSYWMNQPSVVTTAPYHRCHMVETYTFLEDL